VSATPKEVDASSSKEAPVEPTAVHEKEDIYQKPESVVQPTMQSSATKEISVAEESVEKEPTMVQLRQDVYEMVLVLFGIDAQLIEKLQSMTTDILDLQQALKERDEVIEDYTKMLAALQKENVLLRRKCNM